MRSPGEAKTGVDITGRRRVPISVRRASARRPIVKRPAPQDAVGIINDIVSYSLSPPRLIDQVTLLAPFPHSSHHIEHAQVVGYCQAAGPSSVLAVGHNPGILPEQLDRATVIPAGHRTRTAGVFPFRLGGQAITRSLQR